MSTTLEQARTHVENVLLRYERIFGGGDCEVQVITWGREGETDPAVTSRVAEISWSRQGGPDDNFIWAGSSVMQSDMPLGLASCAAVERWMLGQVIGDPMIAREARQDYHFLGEERMIDLNTLEGQNDLIDAASDLKTEDGANPEYDRALVELTRTLLERPAQDSHLVACAIGVSHPERYDY